MDNTSWNNLNREETDSSDAFDGATKFCPNCGGKLPEAAAFCPYCGFGFGRVQPDTVPVPEETTVLRDQSVDSTFEWDAPITSGGTSQHLYEYEAGNYDNNFNNQMQSPKKKKSVVPILAIIFAAAAAVLVGFFVFAPLMFKSNGPDPDTMQTSIVESTVSTTSADNKAGAASNAATAETATSTSAGTSQKSTEAKSPESTVTTITMAKAVTLGTPTPQATPLPTATPLLTATPLPTATPTDVPPQTISQPNIIDASTGQPIYIPNDTATSYAYPDSGSRIWAYGDVNGMTAGQVRYCINEIYAKHGYIFQNENWLNYFKQKTWYSPTVPKASFGDQYLNANEVANVKLLNQYYADRKFPDY